MNQKGDVTGLVVGGGMATAPALVDVPFYESTSWLSAIAIMGMIVLAITAIHGLFKIRREFKWNGEERRGVETEQKKSKTPVNRRSKTNRNK